MKRKAYVIFWAVLTLIISCKDKKSTNAGEKKKARIVMAMARTFYPSRYTGGKWLNGINVEEKKQFFLQVAKNVPAPIQAGYRLKFAAAGIATVQNIFRLEKNEHSFIFVRLDKQLDPSKDGFPFPIYFYGCTIKPSAYSDGKKWKNGIQIQSKREFFFTMATGESLPCQAGDILRFDHSGPAIVRRSYRLERKNGSFLVFIQVNRDLDPDADGYPHAVELIADEK